MKPDISPMALHQRLEIVERHALTMIEWKASIEESTEVNKEMVEVGRALLKALGWVAVGAKWIAYMSAGIGAVWYGFKHLVIMAGRAQ